MSGFLYIKPRIRVIMSQQFPGVNNAFFCKNKLSLLEIGTTFVFIFSIWPCFDAVWMQMASVLVHTFHPVELIDFCLRHFCISILLCILLHK